MTNPKHPPIFVISLAKDTQRRAWLVRQLQRYGLCYEVIDGVDGRLLSDAYIDSVCSQKRAMQSFKNPLTKGEIGCALSHLAIYQKMLKENIAQAIILEDDAIIDDLFATVIRDIAPELPKDWQLLLLGYNDNLQAVPYRLCSTIALGVRSMYGFVVKKPLELIFGTHAYLINLQGAKKLLQQTDPIVKPIDHYTGHYKNINTYLLNPRCAGTNRIDSIITYERDIINIAKSEVTRKTIYFKMKSMIKSKFTLSCHRYILRYYLFCIYTYRATSYKVRYFLNNIMTL